MSAPSNLGAMARLRAAMEKLKPTPGDAKSDLLVVIASRLIMNSGNPVRISDVLNASSCAPADAWVARAFGEDVRLTAEMVETALSRAKDHFQRAKDGRFIMKGWPLARRLECRVNEDWGAEWHPDPRLGITLRDLKPDRVPLAKRAREAPVSADGNPEGREPREVVDVLPGGGGGAAVRKALTEDAPPASKKRARTSSEKQRASEAAARESAAKRLERGEKVTARDETARGTKTAPSEKSAAESARGEKKSAARRASTNDTKKPAKPAGRGVDRKKTKTQRQKPTRGTEEELDETDDDDVASKAEKERIATGAARAATDDKASDDALEPVSRPASAVDPGDVASNVRFFGEARGSDVHRHRTYYDGFDVLTRKGSDLIEAKYVTGDLVYCLPGAEDEAMYLAQIESVFSDPSGQWVDCAWLERGSDLRALVKSDEVWREVDALDGEVFLTLAVNTNAVQTIEGKCRVVTEARWERERAEAGKKTFGQTKKKKEPEPPQQETFVCRRALIGPPPGEKKKKPSGKSADAWAKAAVAGMFAPVTFEEGVGFRAVLPSANKGRTKKGKGKR
jgi:hypothetical protein